MPDFESTMELICDCCHWPYVCDEEELEERCAEREIEKEIRKLLERKEGPMKEITITVKPGENFTPAGLMQRYARETAGVEFDWNYWRIAQLTIDGREYQYHHYGITRTAGDDVVVLFLQEIAPSGADSAG